MKLKSSLMTGEFWLYGAIAAAMLYMQSKGITAADIKAHGEALIIRAQDYVTELAPLVLAIAFGIKRTILKWQQTRAELQIELAKIRGAVAGDGGDAQPVRRDPYRAWYESHATVESEQPLQPPGAMPNISSVPPIPPQKTVADHAS